MDAHTHVFPPEIIEKRDLIAARDNGFSIIYGDKRSRMADGAGLAAYMAEEGIDRAVATGFPFADEGLTRLVNDYLLQLAKDDGRIIPFASVAISPGKAAATEAVRCAAQGARGVGEIAYYEGGFGESERLALEDLACATEQAGLVLMLHLNEQVGHAYTGKTRADFNEVTRLVQAHPGLKIILAHMGGGICFYEFMPEIRKAFSLVYYDLAAVPFLYSDELYHYVERFLPAKVLFGSDFPLLRLSRYGSHLEKVGHEARGRILYENGRELFGE